MSNIQLIPGIITGLAATGAGWIIKSIIYQIIIPLFQHITFSGYKIEGIWTTQLGSDEYKEMVQLKRFGSKVWGVIEVKKSPSGADINKKYKFKGFFKNNFLNCHYEIKDKSSFDNGNFVLKATNGGKVLVGFSISYYDPDDSLECLRYTWEKIK